MIYYVYVGRSEGIWDRLDRMDRGSESGNENGRWNGVALECVSVSEGGSGNVRERERVDVVEMMHFLEYFLAWLLELKVLLIGLNVGFE